MYLSTLLQPESVSGHSVPRMRLIPVLNAQSKVGTPPLPKCQFDVSKRAFSDTVMKYGRKPNGVFVTSQQDADYLLGKSLLQLSKVSHTVLKLDW